MNASPSIAIIIPARYGSTRFPGKPLAEIGGRTMLSRVYDLAGSVAKRTANCKVFITSDDERIANHAKDIGALAIAMACVPSDQAPLPCDIDIRLLTGPELLTGSTRLKAGTATKMALNIISTAVMVRLGKVYGNRMVDVSASNSKLVDRSLRILRDLAAVERDRGLALLDEADGSVKLALLIAVGELEPGAARELLQTHSGQLREALASLGLNLAQS